MSAQTNKTARLTLLSFLEDYLHHGKGTMYVHRRGLRSIRWSYARLVSTARRFARELEARDINRGDRVLLCGENSPEWATVFWGSLLRGAVVVPLDTESSAEFLSSVQQQTDAKLIVASGDAPAASSLRVTQLRLENLSEQVARHSDAQSV